MGAVRSTIHSACECQATLFASLDEKRLVVEGWAKRGATESAPAHTLNPEDERFDVSWSCPFCGRNVLRTFYVPALRPAPTTGAA
ncbi:MAG: hypothetical protein JRI23_26220 [Deltaproteobacteria bacterium]|jgi:hypothetical protein|nr:hypothetical protein [Deltaproteobacteria bacterium]MBW2535528.1 hypothetical protein [Deltaproteobacteria bacterium]